MIQLQLLARRLLTTAGDSCKGDIVPIHVKEEESLKYDRKWRACTSGPRSVCQVSRVISVAAIEADSLAMSLCRMQELHYALEQTGQI